MECPCKHLLPCSIAAGKSEQSSIPALVGGFNPVEKY